MVKFRGVSPAELEFKADQASYAHGNRAYARGWMPNGTFRHRVARCLLIIVLKILVTNCLELAAGPNLPEEKCAGRKAGTRSTILCNAVTLTLPARWLFSVTHCLASHAQCTAMHMHAHAGLYDYGRALSSTVNQSERMQAIDDDG